MRRTGDPYIMHCIETACIVEGLLNTSEYAEDDERCASVPFSTLHCTEALHCRGRLVVNVTAMDSRSKLLCLRSLPR